MRVLGIDPGTAVLGFGVVETGTGTHPRLLECGTLTTRPRDPLPRRLRVIHEGTTALLARHRPDAVAVESAFYGKNVRTTVVLSHARGVTVRANPGIETFIRSGRSLSSEPYSRGEGSSRRST